MDNEISILWKLTLKDMRRKTLNYYKCGKCYEGDVRKED